MKPATEVYIPPLKWQRILPPSPPSHNTHRSKHSTKDIPTWYFQPDSVAACFKRDIWALQKNEVDTSDFYWLGGVPCRSVKIVGMVVGVHVYEKRTLYTLDDGTSVIDCSQYMQPSRPPPAQQVVSVGQCVQVIGVVRTFRQCNKEIRVTKLEICASSNDELFHTRAVRELHRTTYSNKHDFIIPNPTAVLCPRVPLKKMPNPANSALSNPPLFVPSKPNEAPVHISSTKKVPLFQHPSRLPTAELTANTFRLYLKYYMDSTFDDDSVKDNPTTSTKRPRPDETPCTSVLGFTLSYLRRVPELSLLASRVVDAVSKQRARDSMGKTKENGIHPAPSAELSPVQKHAKMKELFHWAIAKNHSEGCIMVWDGPVRQCSNTPITSTNHLWNGTLFSNSIMSMNDDNDGVLSDPSPSERAYVSSTLELVNNLVVNTFKMLVKRKEAMKKPYAGATKNKIVNVLKNDKQWRNVGTRMIDESLKTLEAEEVLWKLGEGRWDLTE